MMETTKRVLCTRKVDEVTLGKRSAKSQHTKTNVGCKVSLGCIATLFSNKFPTFQNTKRI